jgi:glucose 1-dehydrogenase
MFENALNGRVAVVTGGESGIGAACAIALAAAGADVAITYFHDRAGADAVVNKIVNLGRRALAVENDVRVEMAVEELFDRVKTDLGLPDILVNSAGINMAGVEIADMTTDQWNNMLQTDLTGTFFTCRRFVRDLKEAGKGGTIVNITSIHADVMRAGGADYMAAKGAQKNFTETLALEVAGDGITVNAIAPGMILTPMNEAAMEHWTVRTAKSQFIPLKRPGEPEEVANVAVFLASPAGAYFTASTLTIDGGLSKMLALGA